MNKHPRNLSVEIKCPKQDCRNHKQAFHLARKKERRPLAGVIAAVNGSFLRRSGMKKDRTGGEAMARSLAKTRLSGLVRQHKERRAARLARTGWTIRKRQTGLDENSHKTEKKSGTGVGALRKRKAAKSVSLYRPNP